MTHVWGEGVKNLGGSLRTKISERGFGNQFRRLICIRARGGCRPGNLFVVLLTASDFYTPVRVGDGHDLQTRAVVVLLQPSTVNEKCNTTQLRIFHQFTLHVVGAFLTRSGRPPPHSPPRSRSEIAGRGSDGRGGGDGSRDGCGSLREPSGRASERDLGRSTCSKFRPLD